MFCYSVAKTIASYVVPLGGIDAIAFAGGIGEKSFIKRAKILGEFLPPSLDCLEIVLREFSQTFLMCYALIARLFQYCQMCYILIAGLLHGCLYCFL